GPRVLVNVITWRRVPVRIPTTCVGNRGPPPMVYEAPTSLFELVERPAYPIAELGSHRLMFSIKVMVVALMRAICTNALGRALMPPFADPHANHSSVPASVAPTSLGSARCSHSCPSVAVALYASGDQAPTPK